MIKSTTPKLIIHGLTDEGLIRDHNEDYISWTPELGLVVLADGMGVHNAGEVASKLAVTSITSVLEKFLFLEDQNTQKLDLQKIMRKSVTQANNAIYKHAKAHPECSGMGTTIVMGLFHNESIILGSVGDSRIYRFRKGELKQLTTDHSLVQEMIDNGYMTKEEALESNNRNLITRAMGVTENIDVDIAEHAIEKDDIYLLCSDGLSDMVPDNEIFATLVKTRSDLKRTSEELVALAKKYGGNDNISVILAAVDK